MKTVKIAILIWVLAAIVAGLFGDISVSAEYGATTAGFLKIGVGARAMGLGGAFTSVADDPSAVYWNPAGIARMDKSQLQFSHYSWYQDIKIENLFVTFPGKRLSFGTGITYLDYGKFESYDEAGNLEGELSMYDLAASFSLSLNISDMFSAGATAKYIEQSFDIVKANTYAFDAGILCDFDNVQGGLAAVNIGPRMKFVYEEEDLPASLRIGIALHPFHRQALFATEVDAPFHGNLSIHQGAELNISRQLFARTGFIYKTETLPGTDALSYCLGAGLNYGVGRFDYTFTPSEELTNETIHNFSISISW